MRKVSNLTTIMINHLPLPFLVANLFYNWIRSASLILKISWLNYAEKISTAKTIKRSWTIRITQTINEEWIHDYTNVIWLLIIQGVEIVRTSGTFT